MDISTNNVITLCTKHVAANIAPSTSLTVTPEAPALKEAISELRDLWSTTDSMVRGSRDALYEFLGATYEGSERIATDDSLVMELRKVVRVQYSDDKQKKSVKNKSTDELLLAASMGIEQSSLRSKYKRILANARGAKVSPDRESFKGWLERVGGIVSALASTVQAMKPTPPSSTGASQSVGSKAGDLISRYDLMQDADRVFSSNHLGFTVVLFYTNPTTHKAAQMAVLADKSIVERAITLAHRDIKPLVDMDAAA